jgi:hypothetical protein
MLTYADVGKGREAEEERGRKKKEFIGGVKIVEKRKMHICQHKRAPTRGGRGRGEGGRCARTRMHMYGGVHAE